MRPFCRDILLIPSPLLLNTVRGSVAAYGMRKLRANYNGPAFRVRRSSDNAELDIGFDGQDINVSALSSFIGANSGYIAKWYDQSGNDKHAIQGTTGSQPRIVNAGTIDTQNNKPSCFFGGGTSLANSTFSNVASTILTACAVLNVSSTSAAFNRIFTLFQSGDATDYNNTTSAQLFALGSVKTTMVAFNSATKTLIANDTFRQLSTTLANPGVILYDSGTSVATSGATSATLSGADNLIIGAGGQTSNINFFGFKGYISELIVYPLTHSLDERKIIERNQGAYYGVTVS